jgi:hypothetical protein
MLIPHTRLADPTKEVELAGIDLNLSGAVGSIVLLAIALLLLRRDGRLLMTPRVVKVRKALLTASSDIPI